MTLNRWLEESYGVAVPVLRMPKDQDVPDQSASNPLPPRRKERVSGTSMPRKPPVASSNGTARVKPPAPSAAADGAKQSNAYDLAGVHGQRGVRRQPQPSARFQTQATVQNPVPATTPAPSDPATVKPNQPPVKRRPRRLRWLTSWKLWAVTTLFVCGGSGVFALMMLLQIPGMPNCPAVFWPLASASLRFECARLAANKQTSKDLLEAIALLDALPPNHPMRTEADRLVEQWSQDVLKLAEQDFNLGKLGEAIASARRISPKVSAYRLVEERIQRWQAIWAKAEDLYKKAENELRQQNFRQAFSLAVRLLEVENTYWQTTKYDELTERITVARNDASKLGRANRLADEGGLKNLLEAIKLAKTIRSDSYIYEAAQKAIPRFGRKMLELAQAALDRRNLSEALLIVGKIPEEASLKEDVRDFTVLANAQSNVWQNNVTALEEAIAQAQRVGPGRPLYRKAQQLITRWQLEIEAIAQLDKAKFLVQAGSVTDLSAGIAEAARIDRANPRWNEAQEQIRRWQSQIETIEDRPLLDVADQLAGPEDIPSLEAAIAQAKQVGKGRALYGEAQGKVRKWTAQIQTIQDQPILEQARSYANSGDLRTAVNVAQQIQPGRALYNTAQADVRKWRDTIQAETTRAQTLATLQEARNLANAGSPSALARAIQVADQVPASSPLRAEADTAINDWSQQLLQVAVTQSNYDLPGAIAIVEKIPSRASTYAQAQQLLRSWRQILGR